MSVIRLSRYGKIAALTTAGGSLFYFRDELKTYLKADHPPQVSKHEQTTDAKPQDTKPPIQDLPERVPYLLVGGGTASHSAMRAIRGYDPTARVLIVGSENRNPYMRPMLSKDLWFTDQETRRNLKFGWSKGKDRSIFYECDEFYLPLNEMQTREYGGVSIIRDMRLTHLDPDNKTAHLENGQKLGYEKCLLAPGGKPKTLPELESASEEVRDRVLYFRTANDFLKLEKISETAKKIVIIGGGFLGTELACALSNRSSDDHVPKDQIIYQIYPESGILSKVLPSHLSEFVSSKVQAEGAKIIPNVEVKKATFGSDQRIVLELSDGQNLSADYVVCAIGLEPDVELAKSSGLEVDQATGGYLVNSELEARRNVWVAGDASCFYDRKLGRRRVEHHDHAINSGKLAGENMTGAGKAYTHQSMFWSEVGRDISFEAVGIIDSSLDTVSVFADPEELAVLEQTAAESLSKEINKSMDSDQAPQVDGKDKEPEVDRNTESENQSAHESKRTPPAELDKYSKGVVFYLRDGVIVGILLWNLFSRLTIARRILNEQKKYDDFNEVAKMFNIYLDDLRTI